MTKVDCGGQTVELADLRVNDLPWEAHGLVRGMNSRNLRTYQELAQHMGRGEGNVLASKQAKVTLENGLVVSVLCGPIFYSNGVDTYEAAVLDNGGVCDPEGHLSFAEVKELIARAAASAVDGNGRMVVDDEEAD
jgi:hypothetical protein